VTLSALHIRLLGGFGLIYRDVPIVGVNTARLQSLLAYLILHAGLPQPRQHVAFLLWPDTPESHARNNLRQFLYQLRQALPEHERFLAVDAQTICWRQDEGQVIDVQLYLRALTEVEAAARHADSKAVRHWLEQALAYYQGDLLPSCYDDWITPEREHLRQKRQIAYQKLANVLEEQREYAAAVQIAQQLLRLDPLDEETYILLMRLQSLNRDRQGVRRTYQGAVETLRRELDDEPGEALRQAYEHYQRVSETPSPSAERDAPAGASLTLVGRQPEWQLLQAAWRRTMSGDAHLVLVTGDAGIGKSRLAEELFIWATRQGFNATRTRSYAAEGRLSFAPVTEWLRSPAVRPHLSTLNNVWLTEISRLLPELLSEQVDLAHPEPISEYGQRQRFFEALARAILAAPQPMMLWIDDLQWCDSETLEWLHFLLRFRPHSPLLVLGTARSEESPPDHPVVGLARQLRTEGKLTSIELSSLDAAETARLASQIEGRELEIRATMWLYSETEGNPFFVVETVRGGIGSLLAAEASATSQAEPKSHTLPPRVYAVIAGRLAQLSPSARKVAQLGAAVGRAFKLDVLLHAGQADEAHTVHALDELWQKRIVREQSANVFDFTHDKLREVAYAEISAPQRRLLHRQIARALETINSTNLDVVSALIAAQYEQAGMFEQALPYYQRAGAVAANVYANDDAINLLTRGLALLAQLLPGAERDAQELALQLALSPLYRITKGWTSPEVERGLNRALSLSEKVGAVAQQAQTLYGLQTWNAVAGRFEWVQSTYLELHRLFVQAYGSSPPWAGQMYASGRFHMGHMLEGRELVESIVAVRDDRHVHEYQSSHAVNYLAHGHAFYSHVLWCLGYPQLARNNCEMAMHYAREYPKPFNRAMAITYVALLQEWCADVDTFRAQAERAYALTTECNTPYYHVWASILVHFAQAWQQPDAINIVQLNDAIQAFIDTGARLRLPYYFSLLARAYQRASKFDAGLEAIEHGLAESQQHGQRWWDAELHRLRGELMWSQGVDADEVEAAFHRSIEIAQSQQAKSLELRAATSLARWWQATGRSDAAKQLLVPLYGWFTEGFDTPDLQAAQSFIAQL